LADTEALCRRLLSRERNAVAEALNLIDDQRSGRREAAFAFLDALARAIPTPGAQRIGLTGAPGAGKSTLLDALVRVLRRRGETVGILAVDPSSRRSGGSLLGDRARVRSLAGDDGVFLRSMAARDRLGGVADATWPSLTVLSAVFDRVFVETVGVGQSETEVAEFVDTLLFVAQPGAGDTLQFMKAGVLEHPDLFVVNKSDLGAIAERTARELETGLALAARDGEHAPVLLVSARDADGIEALADALAAHFAAAQDAGSLETHRKQGAAHWALDALTRRYGSFGLDRIGGLARVRAELEASGDEHSPFAQTLAWSREIEKALRA